MGRGGAHHAGMTKEPDPVLVDAEIQDAEPGTLHGDAVRPDEPVSDDRSFTERFRGTTWGAPASPEAAGGEAPAGAPMGEAPPHAPAGRGGRRPPRLAWVGVVLLGGSVLSVALLVLGGSNGTLGGPTPTAPPPRVTPGIVAPAEAAAAIDRLLAVIANPKLAYEVRMRGSVEIGGADIETRFSARIAGTNADVIYVSQHSGSATAEAHVVTVGSRTWLQAGTAKAWRKVRTRPVDLPELDVFAGLTDATQLGHLGSELRRGSRTDHLRTVAGWVSPLATRLLASFPGAAVEEARLDIWVLPDGRPLEVITTLRATVPTPFGPFGVSGQASYVLARVGETAAIKPPK